MTYLISLGGSIIVPNEINLKFLKGFKQLILKRLKRGDRFIIVTGGGMTARRYQRAAKTIGSGIGKDLDWLGIRATRLNAELLATIFRKYCQKKIITNPTLDHLDLSKKIIIGAGWKPGWSTDYVCAELAQKHRIKTIINLSNIAYIYDRDPRRFKKAQPLKAITWQEYQRLVGKKWKPGLNSPFDPIATRLAARLRLRVVVIKGGDLKNFEHLLLQKSFKGTVIEG